MFLCDYVEKSLFYCLFVVFIAFLLYRLCLAALSFYASKTPKKDGKGCLDLIYDNLYIIFVNLLNKCIMFMIIMHTFVVKTIEM